MKTPAKIAALVFLSLLGAACDLGKVTSQATAKTVAVSTLLATPAVEIPLQAVAGNGFDAGLGALDAGSLLTDAGITVPPQTAVFVYFGQRQDENLLVAPVGTPGAKVTLKQIGGGSWSLVDQGAGTYALLDAADAGFSYLGNATYDFTFELSGSTYVGEIVRVPTPETIAAFHPAAGYLAIAAGAPVTFQRPEPPTGQELQLGFVSVFPITASGQQSKPTYTNVPQTPLAFLKLVLAPSDWKQLTVTIPGAAFPDRDHNYVIVLQSAKLGGPKSDNLWTGSAILAGAADIGVVKTNP